jgi:hypothetical protein
MNRYCTFATLALAGTLAFGATPADGEGARPSTGAGTARMTTPPVLRRYEPADSGLVTLPGPRIPPVSRPRPPAVPAAPIQTVIPPVKPEARPVPSRAPKPVFPPDFERDSAVFCQKRIGQWSRPDASNLFGDPLRERPAYSDTKVENGRIYAFSDPTGRYRALELDFAADTGLLRTVIVYPWSMTWMECRHLWGAKVTAVEANNGRTFYSYMNRHLDVLVEPGGKVISLGLY